MLVGSLSKILQYCSVCMVQNRQIAVVTFWWSSSCQAVALQKSPSRRNFVDTAEVFGPLAPVGEGAHVFAHDLLARFRVKHATLTCVSTEVAKTDRSQWRLRRLSHRQKNCHRMLWILIWTCRYRVEIFFILNVFWMLIFGIWFYKKNLSRNLVWFGYEYEIHAEGTEVEWWII